MTNRRVVSAQTTKTGTSKLPNAKFFPRSARRDHPWPFAVTFMIVFSFRFLSAIFTPVMDCDEIYNYVEPLHLILYGRGLQTWEYAPQYGLRSWLLLWIYAILAKVAGAFGLEAMYSKIGVLSGLRVSLAVISSLCQTIFIRAVGHRFGLKTSLILLFFLIFSPGMAHAGHAILPQSFAMNILLLACSSWIYAITCKQKHNAGVYDSINFNLAEDRLREVRSRARSLSQDQFPDHPDHSSIPPLSLREKTSRFCRDRNGSAEDCAFPQSSSSENIFSHDNAQIPGSHPSTSHTGNNSTSLRQRTQRNTPLTPKSSNSSQSQSATQNQSTSQNQSNQASQSGLPAPTVDAPTPAPAPARCDSGAACESSSFTSHALVVWWCCVAGLLGWPFVLIFVIPMGADMVDCYLHVHVVVVAIMNFFRRIILAKLVSPTELIYHAHAHAQAYQVYKAPDSESINSTSVRPPPPPSRMSISTIMHTVLLQWPLHVSTAPLRKRLMKLAQLAGFAVLAAGVVMALSVLVDSAYYGVWTVSVWNIVKYNSNYSGDATDSSQGQQLYGTEPLSYYFINLFLNFNVVWVLCLLQLVVGAFAWIYVRVLVPSGVIELIALKIGHSKYMHEVSRVQGLSGKRDSEMEFQSRNRVGSDASDGAEQVFMLEDVDHKRGNACGPSISSVVLSSSLSSSILTKSRLLKISMYLCRMASQMHILTPLLLWCLVMFPQPHKEERFLYITYPLICLGGAFGLEFLIDLCTTTRDIIESTFTRPYLLRILCDACAGTCHRLGNLYTAYTPEVVQVINAYVSDAIVTIFYNPSNHSLRDPDDPDLYLDDLVNTSPSSSPVPSAPALTANNASNASSIAGSSHAGESKSSSQHATQQNKQHSPAFGPRARTSSSEHVKHHSRGASSSITVASPLPSLFRINIIKRAYRPWRGLSFTVVAVVYLIFTTLSVARSGALINGYSAPGAAFFALFAQLHTDMTHGEVLSFDKPVMLTVPASLPAPENPASESAIPATPILPNIISPLHTPYAPMTLLAPSPSLPPSHQGPRASLLRIAAAISHARLVAADVDRQYVQMAQNSTQHTQTPSKTSIDSVDTTTTISTNLADEASCLARVMLGQHTLHQCTQPRATSITPAASNNTPTHTKKSTVSTAKGALVIEDEPAQQPQRLPYNVNRLRGRKPLNWALHAPMLSHNGFYSLPLTPSPASTTQTASVQRGAVDVKAVSAAVYAHGFTEEMDTVSECACDDIKAQGTETEDKCALQCGTSLRMLDAVLETLHSGYGRHVTLSNTITLVLDTSIDTSTNTVLEQYINSLASSSNTESSPSLPTALLPHLLAVLSPSEALLAARTVTPPHKHNVAAPRNPYRVLNALKAYIPTGPLNPAEMKAVAEEMTVARVCVGHDWYRFPSSFFLPEAQWVGGEVYADTLYKASRAAATKRDAESVANTGMNGVTVGDKGVVGAAAIREKEDVQDSTNVFDGSSLLSLLHPFIVVGDGLAQLMPKTATASFPIAASNNDKSSPFQTLAHLSSPTSSAASTVSAPQLEFTSLKSYHVLARPRLVIDFLESGFGGVLPQHFAESAVSPARLPCEDVSMTSKRDLVDNNDFSSVSRSIAPVRRLPWGTVPAQGAPVRAPHFNDLNQRDAARLVPTTACDWIIEADLRVRTEEFKRAVYDEHRYPSAYPGMHLTAQLSMLDPDRSSGLHRAFFIHPFWFQKNKFMPVTTWERNVDV